MKVEGRENKENKNNMISNIQFSPISFLLILMSMTNFR